MPDHKHAAKATVVSGFVSEDSPEVVPMGMTPPVFIEIIEVDDADLRILNALIANGIQELGDGKENAARLEKLRTLKTKVYAAGLRIHEAQSETGRKKSNE